MKTPPKLNPIAKNLNKFNKPSTHLDRKKALKQGKIKHKQQLKRFIEF